MAKKRPKGKVEETHRSTPESLRKSIELLEVSLREKPPKTQKEQWMFELAIEIWKQKLHQIPKNHEESESA